MDEARWQRIQTLFYAALSKMASERAAFLESACGGDRELLASVTDMLGADADSSSLLDRGLPSLAANVLDTPLPNVISSQEFGPYRLRRMLGEGGMGVVWLAERKDAGNPVAIKFLPHASLSPARRQRFAGEIKTLAKLKHPFIARLYDAGNLDDGTPWFVMEYVDGLRLNEYCREHDLSPANRLRLIRSVCGGVQYAHGQEIIHRDLKPSNILVEANGDPRLLDFGIARELRGQAEPPDLTRPGLRMMTPEYSAPEWINSGTVGFYTDVYSLGVILYEMLAGHLPAPGADLREPDLNLLCTKAMRRDPAERYASVEAFARDIDHYLKGEPLEARPYSLRYRAGKFVTRHRRSLVAASVAFLFVTALAGFFASRLERERRATVGEAVRTERVEQFMLNLFEGGDKAAGPDANLRVATLLDRGVRDAGVLNNEPAVQAELYRTLGRSYQHLGKFDKARSLLQMALQLKQSMYGQGSHEAAECLLDIGLLDIDQGRLPSAEQAIRESMALYQRNFSKNDPALGRVTSALGQVWQERGDYTKAIELFSSAVSMQSSDGSRAADLATSLTGLSDAHFKLGNYSLADDLTSKVLALHKRLYGEHHPLVAEDLRNLGNIQTQWGHYAQAEQYFRQALAIDQSWYGVDHPETADMLNYIAQSLMWQKKYSEAEKLFQRALVSMEHAYGEMHPRVALVLTGLSSVHLRLGERSASISDSVRTLEIYRSAYGEEHDSTATALANLASAYLENKQYSQAEPLLRRAVGLFSKIQSPQHFNTGVARMKLGRTLLREDRFQEAEVETLASYTILSKLTDQSNNFTQASMRDLIKEYEGLKQPDKAFRFRARLTLNTH